MRGARNRKRKTDCQLFVRIKTLKIDKANLTITLEIPVIESATSKAEAILSEIVLGKDKAKLFAKGRSQERIDLIRQAIERLVTNEIPTPVIGAVLKLDSPAVQYHLRWLEKNGRIVRPSKFAHWKWAKGVNE